MPEAITAADIHEGRHIRRASPLAIIPSWLVSVCLHGTLLYLFVTHFPASGFGPGSTTGGPEGESREVGIYVKEPGENGGSTGSSDKANAKAEAKAANEPVPPEAAPAAANPLDLPRANDSIVSDKPPVNLSLPSVSNPALGPGAVKNDAPPSSVLETLANQRKMGANGNRTGTGSGTGSGRGQGAGTGAPVGPFFGIGDRGTRFVYVIDCSGSMADHSAIRVAKDELLSSLETLERTQQFQIIFYNTSPRPMSLVGDGRNELYWATTVNRNHARQYIANVQPEQGTDHMPALRMALRMTPEVIFFLTDADLPQLSAGELNELKRLNGEKTRIHCIKFGTGADLDPSNFMRKLAEQNGGRYRYRDVTSFE